VLFQIETCIPPGLGVAGKRILDLHVPQFAALEYLAALHAFDELGILVAGDDLNPRMAAPPVQGTAGRRLKIVIGLYCSHFQETPHRVGKWRYFSLATVEVKRVPGGKIGRVLPVWNEGTEFMKIWQKLSRPRRSAHLGLESERGKPRTRRNFA
jgi:hypothetical protein